MYSLVIVTKSNNEVSFYETGTCEEMEALHTEKCEDFDPILYNVEVVDERMVSIFSGKSVSLESSQTFKAWGIPHGNGSESVTIQVRALSPKEAKQKMTENGTLLTSELYV